MLTSRLYKISNNNNIVKASKINVLPIQITRGGKIVYFPSGNFHSKASSGSFFFLLFIEYSALCWKSPINSVNQDARRRNSIIAKSPLLRSAII